MWTLKRRSSFSRLFIHPVDSATLVNTVNTVKKKKKTKQNTKSDETAMLLYLVDDEERTEISSSSKVAAADSWLRHRGAAFSIRSSASRRCHAARGLTHTM